MECWQDLLEDPRKASFDKVGCATYNAWMSECISQVLQEMYGVCS